MKNLLIRIPFLILLVIGTLSLLEVIPGYGWLIASVALFLVTLLLAVVLRFQFVKFTETESRLEFRYHAIHPFASSYKMILVEKNRLSGFKVAVNFSGYIKDIFLEEIIDGQLATYPAINLSLFSEAEITTLTETLKKYIRS